MIELERVTDESFPNQVWTDATNTHVIVEEVGDAPHGYRNAGWHIRDEDGEDGPYFDLDDALAIAHERWGDAVALGPALRLERDIEHGEENDGMQWLVEYLAEYGPAGIDAQALARRVFERIEEE